jgi:DNA-binding response OmpR family regulator
MGTGCKREVTKVTEGRKVLVVDDDPAYIKSTELVLSAHGYEVDSARDGDEALDKMKDQRPDVVLLDIMMDWPLDGLHVTREMLRQQRLQGVPIIIVSSILDSEYRVMFPQDEYLHFDVWLDKPCPPAQLVAKVGEVLSRYEDYPEKSSELS